MSEDSCEFVIHDGTCLPATTLVEMAKNAGSYNIAEHYIVSLLNHAVIHNMPKFQDYANDIKKHYNLAPLPSASAPASNNNMPIFESQQQKQAEIALKKYCKMKKEQRELILKKALIQLRLENKELFKNNACWIGIYLVVKDRLDDNLKMKTFCDYSITPSDWPPKLVLGKNSLSNIGRYINSIDKLEPYYLMENNPFSILCDKFWEILFRLIFDEKTNSN